jgi:hypothetical protein
VIDVTFMARERLLNAARHVLPVIGLVAAFSALEDLPKTMPAAYLVPLGEQPEPSDALQGTVQIVRATFGVVLLVKHAGDASGAKATQALQDLRLMVQATLLGWQPVPATDMFVEFAGGGLLALDNGAVVWRDDFSVRRLMAAAPQ